MAENISNLENAKDFDEIVAPSKELIESFKYMLTDIGEDENRDGLLDTPKRAAAAFKFLNHGYKMSLDKVVNNALFDSEIEDMVLVRDIEFYSLCEHHMLPFNGRCHVAYIPEGKVLGLSKIARIVDMFARRLQIQERLTHQIADAITEITGCKGCAVVIEAQHMCMVMRGVQKQNSVMKTSSMVGAFRNNPSTRAEFLALLRS
ncbi:GTP cyclohydrolase I FolE [Gammaproteobacteria bacterium]|jgi:GTP cyclohydrolase I|nr:GTP cyclohydrolase I FolE [Gammaproteobacteria bacterium]